jgi:urease accessory protein
MPLLRLLQLSSAALPVGGYAFSQGLEYAVDSGWVQTDSQVADWVSLLMHESLAHVDLPLLQRLIQAQHTESLEHTHYWNAYALACRETHELRLTDTAMGDALIRLLKQLDIPVPPIATGTSFLTAFAAAAHYWNIQTHEASVGFLWSWLENQIAAATKLVPLGQTSSQKLLVQLGDELPAVLAKAAKVDDDNIGASLPGLAMASSWHETQYSRLFRS